MDVSMISSYHKFTQCTGSQLEVVVEGSEELLNATVELLMQGPDARQASPVVQGYEGALLLFCFALCFAGYRLVRLVNLCAGFALGASLALFFLELVAPQIAQETCVLVVLLTLTVASLVGIVCAAKRQSLYFVLGVIAAQAFGAASYDLLLAAGYGNTAEGTSTSEAARGCISFFAVLGATLVYFYADLAWIFTTALVGAYGTAFFSIKLLVVPYLDPKFEAFTTLRPARILELSDDEILYVYAPFACSFCLAICGFLTQYYCNRRSSLAKKRGVKVVMM